MRMIREFALASALGVLVLTPVLLAGQSRPPEQPPAGFPDLVGALKSTPGCLGVETARTSTGKLVIFAWFENKKAVLTWYYSPLHRGLAKQFFPSAETRTPMPDVPDDGEPVLAVASLTMADKPQSDLTSLPVSQIAIELYRPLPGGLALGGRFAPAELKVKGLIDVPVNGR